MTDLQKTVGVALGVAAFLCLALGGGVVFTLLVSHRASESPPVALSAPSSTAPADVAASQPADDPLARLVLAQAAVKKATDSLAKASLKNHGGFVQKARASANAAENDLSSALAFLAEHPGAKFHPEDTTAIHPATVPTYDVKADGTYGSPNLAHALNNLNDALAQLTATPGSDHLAIPELGGFREKLLTDIAQSQTHILDAYAFAHKQAAPVPLEAPKPGATPALPEPSAPKPLLP